MALFDRRPSKVLDLRTSGRTSNRRGSMRAVMIAATAIIAVAGIAAAGYFVVAHLNSSTTDSKSAMQTAVGRVGKLMLLPTGETPTYGTVADVAKLKGQTFFSQAQNGDEILIYEKAKLSILYRPSLNKIVNVGPLVVGSQGSPYVTSRFAIKNGTDNPDLGPKMATQLMRLYPNAKLISNEKASRAYPTSITIDLTKTNQPLDEQIADSLKIQAGQAPLGEPLPDADFLIIIGSDFK